jgi:hypothetical protein
MNVPYNHKTYMTKKWIGGQTSSAITVISKLHSSYSSINKETQPSLNKYPDVMNVRQALRRVRMGGYTVPKKVSQKK